MSQVKQRSEEGFAHLLLIIIVVVVLAAVALAGWRIMDKHKNPSTGSNTPKVRNSAVESQCLATYHDSDLCSFQAIAAAEPIDKTAFKATLTTVQADSNTTMTFEQDGKGNSSLMSSGGGSALNSITFNGSTYIQNGTTWIRYPSGTSTPTTTNPDTNLSFLSSIANTKFTKLGSEACGNLTCIKYQITDNATPAVKQYAWVDTHDHLMREWSSTDGTSSTDMKLSYEAVTITTPSPVQDFSASTPAYQ